MEGLNLQLITYNVGAFSPGAKTDLASMLSDPVPDLVLIGFQEVNSAPSAVVMDTLLEGEDPWTKRTRDQFAARGLIKIRSIRLMGLVLTLFCLEKHIPYLRGLETQYTRLGLNGYWGNKGTVSVRFKVYGVSVCVLNSHLAAHDQYNQARIEGYNNVVGSHLFTDPETEMIFYHDYVFWLGDLNFRLDQEDTLTFAQINLHIDKKELKPLLEADQLTAARTAGVAFSELQETAPAFPPTFKFKVGTTVHDPKRRPAWTDRILFKANTGNYDSLKLSVNQQNYLSHPHILDSDHIPVSSAFTLQAFSNSLASSLNLPVFQPIVTFHTDEVYSGEDNLVVYTVPVKERRYLKSWDWVGVYRADTHSLQDHVAFLWAPSNPVRDNVYELYFDESVFLRPGNYRFVYYSSESKDILGISKPVPARLRDLVPEVGVEATEEL